MTESADGGFEDGGFEEAFDYGRVQHEPCPVCGHDTSAVPAGDLAALAVDTGRNWFLFLTTVCDHPGGRADLRVRQSAGVWSALEYGCHVRDVLALFTRRVEVTLLTDRPSYDWWDHDGAVTSNHYAEQDPVAVAEDIERSADNLARLVQPLTPRQLSREGTRLDTTFTVEGLVRFAIHEALHHLADARAVVPATS
ncbi:MAG: DinB family protein [Acidimicrobiales bacterium]